MRVVRCARGSAFSLANHSNPLALAMPIGCGDGLCADAAKHKVTGELTHESGARRGHTRRQKEPSNGGE